MGTEHSQLTRHLDPRPPEVRFMQRPFADGLDHELLDGRHLVLTRAIPHVGEIE